MSAVLKMTFPAALDLKPFPTAWLRQPTFDMATLPIGWLGPLDATVLYSIATLARGPMMELGSWAGRSTCAMAYALRDRTKAGGALPRYDVIDFGIAGAQEARERFPDYEPLQGPHADHHAKVLFYPGGSPGMLKQNLVDRDLSRYINHLIFGDFITFETSVRYQAVFCDTTHSPYEIARNVPKLAQFLDPDNFLIAFDDVVTIESAEQIQEIINADKAALSCTFDAQSKLMLATKGVYNEMVFGG